MSCYRLTRPARADLDAIWVFIAAAATPEAADALLDELQAACQRLADHPLSGRLREDLADVTPDLRSVPVREYLIFYRPTPGGVRILRIVHGRRDLRRLLTHGR